MTAEQRRAADEVPFCDCHNHVDQARSDTQWNGVNYLSGDRLDHFAALLRATVIWTLLFGWGEP